MFEVIKLFFSNFTTNANAVYFGFKYLMNLYILIFIMVLKIRLEVKLDLLSILGFYRFSPVLSWC